MPNVTISDLTKRFGNIRAIDSATFDVKDKEYLCILGPTGSGKTTLLRLIAGILRPDEGKITFDERVVNEVPSEERNSVYVPQTYALFPHLTVVENVMFGLQAKGATREEAYDEAIKVLGLVRLEQREHSYPHELSGGMQQRVALARGLASGSKFLLLDEPLGALDARLRIDLRGELRHLAKRQGFTVIHVTHDQEEAMVIADRILVLRKGVVQQHGTPFHVYRKPSNLFVANFVGSTTFFEGVVVKRDLNSSLVRLLGDLTLTITDTSRQPEEDIVLAIRDDRVTLHHESQGIGKNVLPGEITATRFLGRHNRFEARLSNGTNVASVVSSSRYDLKFNIGDKVDVIFGPSTIMTFAYPSRGLRKELEVY